MSSLGIYRSCERGDERAVLCPFYSIFAYQIQPFCVGREMQCITQVLKSGVTGCSAECSGLYANVEYIPEDFLKKKSTEMARFRRLAQEYKIYKDSFAMSRKFDPSNGSLGETLS